MGAADVVPGVSGGTIAFITGIYEELITSLNNINLSALRILFKEGIKPFWKHINGTFFVFLFAGIILSIVTLIKGVSFLLKNEPVLLWSFFFGLIIASIWMVGKSIKKWNAYTILALIVGTAIAFYISSVQTVAHVDAKWYIFLSGAIAICAMILPGISGSFILVLMGSYQIVIEAVKSRELTIIGLFALGCIIGLISFSRVLKWLFEKYKEVTVALLTGFMIGSLYKVWPWKNEVGDTPIVIHSNGDEDWMMGNVLPADFIGDDKFWMACLAAVGGLLLIVVLERFAPKEK